MLLRLVACSVLFGHDTKSSRSNISTWRKRGQVLGFSWIRKVASEGERRTEFKATVRAHNLMKLGVKALIELCIYCWGHPLLYTFSGSVAVWMLLSGNLQHFERESRYHVTTDNNSSQCQSRLRCLEGLPLCI